MLSGLRRRWRINTSSTTPSSSTKPPTLGMWVFLVTEIMFFGGMFTAYVVYRSRTRRRSGTPAITST